MKQKKDLLIAILIDGDNTSPERMEDIMRFVSRYGNAIVKRIFGDWTKKSLAGWKMWQKKTRSNWYKHPLSFQERTRRILHCA